MGAVTLRRADGASLVLNLCLELVPADMCTSPLSS